MLSLFLENKTSLKLDICLLSMYHLPSVLVFGQGEVKSQCTIKGKLQSVEQLL